jgi:hypothetical protein
LIGGEPVRVESVPRSLPMNGNAREMKKELEEILTILMQ